MFSYQVDKEIELVLLQQHDKEELFELIDYNRKHLRQWLLWVDERTCAEDFEPIIPMWLNNYANNNGFDAGIRYNGELVGMISGGGCTGERYYNKEYKSSNEVPF